MNILLVDDSIGDALIASLVIKRKKPADVNVDITEATSLRDATNALKTSLFDCIILDLHLPDGRGYSNIDRLKEFAPQTPIIVMTGSDSGRSENEALKRGASAYISKKPLSQSTDIYAAVALAVDKGV